MGILSKHSDSQWFDHSRKRLRFTLDQELAENLEEAQRQLFNDGKGSMTDSTIWCGTRSWNVHTAVIATRCPFFKACSQGNFEEAKTNVVYLDDDNAGAIGVLLEYLYTLSADTVTEYLEGKKDPVEHLIPLIKAADKYDQPLLLEQIYIIFENPKLYSLTTASMLRVLSEIDSSIGISVWITRMQEVIITFLINGGLDAVDSAAAEALQKYPAATRRIIEAMSKTIADQARRIADTRGDITQDSDQDLYSDVEEMAAAMDAKARAKPIARAIL